MHQLKSYNYTLLTSLKQQKLKILKYEVVLQCRLIIITSYT